MIIIRIFSKSFEKFSIKSLSETFLEHEACASDIAELHWHVSYKSKAEAKALKKRNAAETMNRRLIHDIDFVKKHW